VSQKVIRVGAKVEADFQKIGVWYPGEIVADYNDGTYDIHYDDGDTEERVPRNRIKIRRTMSEG
jgi:hypothetical protein